MGREREMCRGDLGWGPRISDLGGPSSGRLWGGRRTMSLLAVTGQSKKTRVTITLATRQQAKLSLSVPSLSLRQAETSKTWGRRIHFPSTGERFE